MKIMSKKYIITEDQLELVGCLFLTKHGNESMFCQEDGAGLHKLLLEGYTTPMLQDPVEKVLINGKDVGATANVATHPDGGTLLNIHFDDKKQSRQTLLERQTEATEDIARQLRSKTFYSDKGNGTPVTIKEAPDGTAYIEAIQQGIPAEKIVEFFEETKLHEEFYKWLDSKKK